MKNERRQNSEIVLENKKVMIVVVGEARGEADFLSFFLPSDCSRKGIMRSADRLCWKAKIPLFLKLLWRRREGAENDLAFESAVEVVGAFCRPASQLFPLFRSIGAVRLSDGGVPVTVAVRRLPLISFLHSAAVVIRIPPLFLLLL